MKRIIAAISAILLSFSAFAGAEPLVVLSTAAPAMTGGGIYDLGEEMDRYPMAIPLALPFLIEDSGISFDSLFLGGFLDKTKALWDVAMISSSLADVMIVEGRGTVSVLPDVDFEEGKASIAILYDDVELLYRGGGLMDTGSISGKSVVSASVRTEPLLTVSVDAGTTIADGCIELSLFLDEEKLDKYLGLIGMTRSELREYGMETARAELSADLLSLVLGLDVESASGAEVIDALSGCGMLDLLDLIGLATLSSDSAAMCIVPRLLIDGEEPGIDLQRVMKDVIRLTHVYGMMQ